MFNAALILGKVTVPAHVMYLWAFVAVACRSRDISLRIFQKIQTFLRSDRPRSVWFITDDLPWIQFVKSSMGRTPFISNWFTGNISSLATYLVTKTASRSSLISWCCTAKKYKAMNEDTGWILISECQHAETASQSSCWYELCSYIHCAAKIW